MESELEEFSGIIRSAAGPHTAALHTGAEGLIVLRLRARGHTRLRTRRWRWR